MSRDDTELHDNNRYHDKTPLTGESNSKTSGYDPAKTRIYGTLIAMSFVFLALNVIQIILIYKINHYWWTAVTPAIIFAGFTILLSYEGWHFNLTKRFHQAKWTSLLPKFGIVATCFLNIIAVEFVYLNAVAVPAARSKTWRTSLTAHESISAPAMALAQGTYFASRAILANNNTELDQLYQNQTSLKPSNQAAFTNYSSFPVGPPPGGFPGDWQIHYVLFNGSLEHQMSAIDDLNLVYNFYWNINFDEASLGFLVFDSKFLEQGMFEKAFKCGIINGDLFSAYSRSQLSLEKIVVKDEVSAIDYSGLNESCQDAAFREYVTYRPLLIPYGPPLDRTGCAVNGTTVPSGSDAIEACTGAIDVQFSTMLVTTETSQYSKNRVQMLTDEGGIIGGIMFVTWFLSIVNQ